jgi:hypothetical protein
MSKLAVIRSIAITWLCILILAVPLAMAEEPTESFSVYTDKEEYIVGEAVNVHVIANAIDPNETITVTDVIAYDPANVSVAEWHNLTIILTDTTTPEYVGTLIAESEGNYTVSAEGWGCAWRLRCRCRFRCRRWRRPIPEVPLGTIMAIVAFLGATGVYAVQKKHPKKKRKK